MEDNTNNSLSDNSNIDLPMMTTTSFRDCAMICSECKELRKEIYNKNNQINLGEEEIQNLKQINNELN